MKLTVKKNSLNPSMLIHVVILIAAITGLLYADSENSENGQIRANQARNAKTMDELFNIKKLSHELRNAETVRLLKGESLDESLRRLHRYMLYERGEDTMFYINDWVMNKESEKIKLFALRDIEEIMGNRRVLKIYKELSRIDKKKASEIVSKEIMNSLPIYKETFDRYLQTHADNFKKGADSRKSHGFVVIASWGKNRISIREIRYKVLALCFLAAQLELDCSHALEKVVDVALEHLELTSDRGYFCSLYGLLLRFNMTLYNKQILGTAIVKAGSKGDKKALKQDIGIKWKKKKLTTFDAVTTDADSRSHFMRKRKADYSRGAFNVEFIEKISDEQFDYLLHNLKQ